MFKNRSKAAFFGLLLAIAYSVYLVTYMIGANSEVSSDAEALGAGIATLLVLPSLLVLFVGILLGLIGFFGRSSGLHLTAAILYSVSAFLFILYAPFLIPSIVLAFVGWNNQKKINKSQSA